MSRHTDMLHWCLVCWCLVKAVLGAGVSDKYAAAGVKPDVVSVAPPNLLQVEYPEGPAALGDTLQVSKTGSQPLVSFPGADPDQLYTIAMVDPDAPSRENPRAAQWNHWLVTNIEGSALAAGGEVDGKVLMKYSGPAPPQGSGPHRYVLLVYKQAGSLNSRVSRARARFDIEGFAKKNKLGNPVAGNYFFAENI